MPLILRKAARPARLDSPAPALDEPVSVLAALIGALTNPERYSVVARDGELFIRPARWGASRLAKRRWRPILRPASALCGS